VLVLYNGRTLETASGHLRYALGNDAHHGAKNSTRMIDSGLTMDSKLEESRSMTFDPSAARMELVHRERDTREGTQGETRMVEGKRL
jgi:hypothetical protein